MTWKEIKDFAYDLAQTGTRSVVKQINSIRRGWVNYFALKESLLPLSEEKKANLRASIAQMRRLTPWGTALFVTAIGATAAFMAKMRLEGMIIPRVFDLAPLGIGISGACFELVLARRYRRDIRLTQPDPDEGSRRKFFPGSVGLIFTFIPLLCGIVVTLGLSKSEIAPASIAPPSNCPNFCPKCGTPWPIRTLPAQDDTIDDEGNRGGRQESNGGGKSSREGPELREIRTCRTNPRCGIYDLRRGARSFYNSRPA